MSEHFKINDLLPLYVAGSLDKKQAETVRNHLAICEDCREDLMLWQAMAGEVVHEARQASAPLHLAELALDRIETEPVKHSKVRQIIQLLLSQIPLVRREIWPASGLIMVIGYIIAILVENEAALYFIAPMLAAAGVGVLYGNENDPAFELTLATPTTQRQILLARLAAVFGYNLVLGIIASFALIPVLNMPEIQIVILNWLAPMALLASLALLFSVWIGTSNAISVTYFIWLSRYFLISIADGVLFQNFNQISLNVIEAYLDLWQNPVMMLSVALVLSLVAFWSVSQEKSNVSRLV
jgi:anti-sigma factor RsiW